MSTESEETTDKKEAIDPARQQWISVAAYFKAEQRGFRAGKELDDWLEAECEYIQFQVELFILLSKEDGGMTLVGLQQLAILVGVTQAGLIRSEKELIQLIQKASKARTCFQSEKLTVCEEHQCPWKEECQKLVAEWMR
jgi:hypothetical protein